MSFENSHIFQPSPVLDLEGLGRMFYIASPSATSFPGDDDGGDVDDDGDGDGGDDDGGDDDVGDDDDAGDVLYCLPLRHLFPRPQGTSKVLRRPGHALLHHHVGSQLPVS